MSYNFRSRLCKLVNGYKTYSYYKNIESKTIIFLWVRVKLGNDDTAANTKTSIITCVRMFARSTHGTNWISNS